MFLNKSKLIIIFALFLMVSAVHGVNFGGFNHIGLFHSIGFDELGFDEVIINRQMGQ
ncbi:MAG: hypothetical protein LBD03_01360 [Methanobrevibacter sp.]|jgi:hypothetical protein|nr:hypothetical protein [Candidatus Methanovirga procula]